MPDTDDLISAAFAGFARAAVPYVRPAGLAPVRATVRRRRTTRLTVVTVAAVLAVVVPLTFLVRQDRHAPIPTTTPSVSASPSAPAPSPAAPSSGTATPGAPATIRSTGIVCPSGTTGAFGPASLCDAKVTIPAGVCGAGTATFHQGTFASDVTMDLDRAVQVDVNRDGTADVVAIIGCGVADPGGVDVIAFTRGPSGGAVKTLGLLVGSKFPANGAREVHGAVDLEADTTGAVKVHVDNLGESDEYAHARAVYQWRTYAWNGTAFAQTAGHTSFFTSTAKLGLTTTKITADPVKNGRQRFWFKATVTNKGSSTATSLSVYGMLHAGATPEGCGHKTVDSVDSIAGDCTIASLAPGQSRTVTFADTVDAGTPALDGSQFVQLRAGDQIAVEIPAVPLA
jgi:hypothetical protein